MSTQIQLPASTLNAVRPLLTIREAVAQTGLSEATIRRRIRSNALPHRQIGGRNKKILVFAHALLMPEGSEGAVAASTASTSMKNEVQSEESPKRRGPKPQWQRLLAETH